MSEKRLAGWAASTQKPEEISNRIKGVVLALSGVIILVVAQIFNIEISANDVSQLAGLLGTFGGSLWAMWGAGMALMKWIATVQE